MFPRATQTCSIDPGWDAWHGYPAHPVCGTTPYFEAPIRARIGAFCWATAQFEPLTDPLSLRARVGARSWPSHSGELTAIYGAAKRPMGLNVGDASFARIS